MAPTRPDPLPSAVFPSCKDGDHEGSNNEDSDDADEDDAAEALALPEREDDQISVIELEESLEEAEALLATTPVPESLEIVPDSPKPKPAEEPSETVEEALRALVGEIDSPVRPDKSQALVLIEDSPMKMEAPIEDAPSMEELAPPVQPPETDVGVSESRESLEPDEDSQVAKKALPEGQELESRPPKLPKKRNEYNELDCDDARERLNQKIASLKQALAARTPWVFEWKWCQQV